MNRSELEHLIQDHLDGCATREESERLPALLARHSEGKARYREMEVVFGALRAMALADPPPGLTAAVRLAEVPPVANRGRSFGAPRPRLRMAVAFAAGVVTCVLAFTIAERVGLDRLPGDLPLGGTLPRSIAGTRVLDTRRAVLARGELLLESRRVGQRITISVESRGTGGPLVVLDYDERSMVLAGLRRESTPALLADAAVLAPGRIELRPASTDRYTFDLVAGPSTKSVEVTIHDGGRVFRESLATGPGGSAPQPSPPKTR